MDKMKKNILFYIRLFLPFAIPIILGIVWVFTVVNKINDPRNYPTPLEMPLVQEHAGLKLLLGICIGIIVGTTAAYLSTFFERPEKKWKAWWFWLWIMELGFMANFMGGLPDSDFRLFPQKDLAIAWAPFRISFTASCLITLGLSAIILIVNAIEKQHKLNKAD